MSSNDHRVCDCGKPEWWVAHPHFPIEFDERMNEYHLVHNGARAVMRYCFWCGGRLPESKRGTFFTTPDEAEKAEVRALLKGVNTREDVERVLGPPDEIYESGCDQQVDDTTTGPALGSKRYRYSKRWKSLILELPITEKGRFGYAIMGRPLGHGQIDCQ